MKAEDICFIATNKETGQKYSFSLADISTAGPGPDDAYGAFIVTDVDTGEYQEIPDWEIDDYDYEMKK